MQHTRVRTTDDIDALLAVPQIGMPGFFEALAERGFTVDLMRNVREFRDGGLTSTQFQGVRVDLLRPVLPAYAHVLDRAIAAEILGKTVQISDAEGLIVMKVMAMRPQDQTDIKDLIEAYGGQLDVDYIRTELDTFTEANDPKRVAFESWIKEASERK